MILLDIGPHALKEIERIKTVAERDPVSEEQLHHNARINDLSFPEHLTTIVPQGWHVGYIVEQQPQPYGLWRRLRVTLDREQPPPQEGVIKLMQAFGFECQPQDCVWVPEQTSDMAVVCVMEPLGGPPMMENFMIRMALAEQISEAQGLNGHNAAP